ncbi:hypothetical protein I4F81_005681 [Pyropia yezoensis]|uniref:Uncharacterized protein n=1 Tax=Pyropia yezoensis TaxID=2788 RepID=A0ACC3BYJ0_PYRYE|nr:hypothetical protein I4F81_005681 [Neopyropia yezoensis]
MVVEAKTAAGGGSQRRPRHQQVDAAAAAAVAVVDEPVSLVGTVDSSALPPLPASGEAPPGGGPKQPPSSRRLSLRVPGGFHHLQDPMAEEAALVATVAAAALPEVVAPAGDLVAGGGGASEARERRRKRLAELRVRSASGGTTTDRGRGVGGRTMPAGRSAERGTAAGAAAKTSGVVVDTASVEAGGSSKAIKASARSRVRKTSTPRAATVAGVSRPSGARGEADGGKVVRPVDGAAAVLLAPTVVVAVPSDSPVTGGACPPPDAVGGVDVACGEASPMAVQAADPSPSALTPSLSQAAAPLLDVTLPRAEAPKPLAVAEAAPHADATSDATSGPAGLLDLSADPLAAGPPVGTAPAEVLDDGAPRPTSDEAHAAAVLIAASVDGGSGGDDRGGGEGGRQPRDATSPVADKMAVLTPAVGADAKEVVRLPKAHKVPRVRSAKAKTARSSRALKDGTGATKTPRSARSLDAGTAKTGLSPRTPSRDKSQASEVPGGRPGRVAGTATLQAATVSLGGHSSLPPEGPGAPDEARGPIVEAVEAEPAVAEPAHVAGVANTEDAVSVVEVAAADAASEASAAELRPAEGTAAASTVKDSHPVMTALVANARAPLYEGVPLPEESQYRRQRSRSEPPVPGSRKARHSAVSSHLSSASSTSRHIGGAGSSVAGSGVAPGSSGTFSDSMLSNSSANGSLRLALALSRASSSTSSFASPATTENLPATAPIANGSLVVDVGGANNRHPPSTARARNHGASPSLSMGSGRRTATHTPSSLRDLRKVSGALSGRLLALRRERSVGLQDDRDGGGDGSGGDGLPTKVGGLASRLGSFDRGGLLGPGKAARDQAVMESSPSLSGAGGMADSAGSGTPSRRIYSSNGHVGNRFLASSFSGGTTSSRRLGALLRAASGAAGTATAGLGGMAARSSSRVRPSRTSHLGVDALPPGGGGGESGSGSGGSGGEVPTLGDLTDASSRTYRRVLPASSTSSNASLSPAAKAAAISSPSFVSIDRPGRLPEVPVPGDRPDGASKITGLMFTDRGRGAKTTERMFATELTSVSQLVASNVQFRESDMGSGGRRVSARLRRRPVSVPAAGGATAVPPVPAKGGGKDADARERLGQPPRLVLTPSDKAVEGSASAGELRLSSPVTPSSS